MVVRGDAKGLSPHVDMMHRHREAELLRRVLRKQPIRVTKLRVILRHIHSKTGSIECVELVPFHYFLLVYFTMKTSRTGRDVESA